MEAVPFADKKGRLETKTEDNMKTEVLHDEREGLASFDRNEKVNVPTVGIPKVPKGDDDNAGGKKMDLGSINTGDDEKKEMKKASMEAKSPTICNEPVFRSKPKLPLPSISGPLPSFMLRSKPSTPNSAPANRSTPLFDSSDSVKVPRFGVAKAVDGDHDVNNEGPTASKLLKEISAVDVEMKTLRKEMDRLKSSLDGALPSVELLEVERDSEFKNRKLATDEVNYRYRASKEGKR